MSFIPPFKIGIWNAWIFMIWLVITIFLPNLIIKDKDALKNLRVSAPMKYEKVLNIISMAAIFIGFIYSIFLPLKFNSLLFYIGLIIFICSLIVELSVFYTLQKAKFDEPFMKGPYKYSRHPLYLFVILAVVSIIIMTFSWIFLLILFILIIHLLLVVPAEEKYCIEKYGEKYQTYLKKTPRWIGFLKKLNKEKD